MKYKKILLPAFVLMVLVQLFVPANMIWEQEKILKEGTAFKFKTRPVDPNDPFRGRYVRLDFEINSMKFPNQDTFEYDVPVYVSLDEDELGFAKIKSLDRMRPESGDYVEAQGDFYGGDKSQRVHIEYPFDRFYMDEYKAMPAEIMLRESASDSTVVTYALVKVLDGKALIENVFVNDIPLQQYVEQQQ